MPTYEYECTACQTRFERFQKFTDAPVTECPECGGAVRRVIFPAGVVFKGSGWYITDSRRSTSSESSSTSGESEEKKSEPASAPTAEAKSESKAESKPESKPEPSSSAPKSDSGASKSAAKS